MTKDVLLRIFNHTVELKLWDTKEKVSPRARFDRPKAFKLPPQRGNEEAEIDSIKRLIAEEMRERLEGNIQYRVRRAVTGGGGKTCSWGTRTLPYFSKRRRCLFLEKMQGFRLGKK